MNQKGFVFKKGSSWFLRYRDFFVVNGQQVRKQKCVKLADVCDRYRRESDLSDLASEKMDGVKQAAKCPGSWDTFANFVENEYLPHVRRTKAASTAAGYRSYWLSYIKPRVAQYTVRDFTMKITSDLLEDIARAHPLNVETIGKVRSILSGIFTFALAKGAYPGKSAADNPCAGALLPEAQPKSETVAATKEDVRTILAHLQSEGLLFARAAVATVAFLGCRPGEARGLRWTDWDRPEEQIHIQRSVWHTTEKVPKTKQSVRFVAVASELRSILLALWESQGRPISGYILARADGGRANLDNESKRVIAVALTRCATCKKPESEKHFGHVFTRDESLPKWNGFYSLRRFHATEVRQESSSETVSKALGNTRQVADDHYIKPIAVLPDVRRAVNSAMRGLVN